MSKSKPENLVFFLIERVYHPYVRQFVATEAHCPQYVYVCFEFLPMIHGWPMGGHGYRDSHGYPAQQRKVTGKS